MSALQIFQLAPGQRARFQVLPVGGTTARGATALQLRILRPDEGRSLELELELHGLAGPPLGRGRVPLGNGYLALIKEVQRQLSEQPSWGPSSEFELLEPAPEGAAASAPGLRTHER